MTRIAISWRGSSPSGGRPTRRMDFSCSADESGMSEKSSFRRVRRTFAAAGTPRADDPDRFRIATSPEGYTRPWARSAGRSPNRRNRDSADECCRSGPSSASGSRNTVTASSNQTPCFAALASAFRGSHSNTHLVDTKGVARLGRRLTRTSVYRVVRRNCESFLCQNCVTYPAKPWVNTVIYGDTSTRIDVG